MKKHIYFSFLVVASTPVSSWALDENRTLASMLDSAFSISRETIPQYSCDQIGENNPCPKVLEDYVSEASKRRLVDYTIINSPYKKGGAIGSCSQVQTTAEIDMKFDTLEDVFRNDPQLSADYTLFEISPACTAPDKLRNLGVENYESGIKNMSAAFQYFQKRLEQGMNQALLGLASIEAHDFNYDGVLSDVNCDQLGDKEVRLTCKDFKGCAPKKAEKTQKFNERVDQSIDALIEVEYQKGVLSKTLPNSEAFKKAAATLKGISQQYPWLDGKEFKKFKSEIIDSPAFRELASMRKSGKVDEKSVRADGLLKLNEITGKALKKQFQVSADITKARIAEFQRATMCLQGASKNCDDFQEILKRTPELNYQRPELEPVTDEEKNAYRNLIVGENILSRQKCIHAVKGYQESDSELQRDTFIGVTMLAFPIGRIAMTANSARVGVMSARAIKVADYGVLGADASYMAIDGARAYQTCKNDFQKIQFEPISAPPSCQMLGVGMSTVHREYQQCLIQSGFAALGGVGVLATLKAMKHAPQITKTPPKTPPKNQGGPGVRAPSGNASIKTQFTRVEVTEFESFLKDRSRLKGLEQKLPTTTGVELEILGRQIASLKESVATRTMNPEYMKRLKAYQDIRVSTSNAPVLTETIDDGQRILAELAETAKKKAAIQKQYSKNPHMDGYVTWVGENNRSFKPMDDTTVYLDLDPRKMGADYEKTMDKLTEILRKEEVPHMYVKSEDASKVMGDRFNKGKSLAFNMTPAEEERVLKAMEDVLIKSRAKRSDVVSTDLIKAEDSIFFYKRKPVSVRKTEDPNELFNHNKGGWITNADGKLIKYKGEYIPASKDTMREVQENGDLWMILHVEGAFK